MKEMKTLKFPNQDEPYEIVDAYARETLNTELNKKVNASDLTTETWTFTLADGSTVTKNVVMQ